VKAALREARGRRLVLCLFVIAFLTTLLFEPRARLPPWGILLPILGLLLLALWRTVLDIRGLARARSCSLRDLCRAFS